MIPYVPLSYLCEHFRVIDPDVRMEYEMTHHMEM